MNEDGTKSVGRRNMLRRRMKPCRVFLDPNEVQRNLCRKPEQCEPVYSVWMSTEEAELVHSILAGVKQDEHSTEHIKSEVMEEILPSKGDTELLTQMEDGIPPCHIKSEPMEDIPSEQDSNMEDGILSCRIKSKPMEDIPSQCEIEFVEVGIPTHHIKSERMVDIPSQNDTEYVEEDRTPPWELCETVLTENEITSAETEFVYMAKLVKTEDPSSPIPNNVPLHIPAKPIGSDVMVRTLRKILPKPVITESKGYLSEVTITRTKDREMLTKITDEFTRTRDIEPHTDEYLCSLCPKSKDDNISSELDLHLDTTFKKCRNCHKKCINISDYYFHTKHCESKSSDRDINFMGYVAVQNSLNKYWWKLTCKNSGCNQRMPNFCSKIMHEMYCATSVPDPKFFILPESVDYKCSICYATFKDQCLFQAHCTLPILFASTYCKQCDVKIESEQDYMMHIKSKGHKLNCQLCDMKFKDVNTYISHKSNEHNVRMIHCSGCSKTATIVQFKVSHFNVCFSKGVESFVRSLCGTKCVTYDEFRKHMTKEIAYLKFEFQCRKCHNYFCSKFNLFCHMVNSQCVSEQET